MELQWPLILFTTFVAWSGGLFATQGIMAVKGEGNKAQMKALIVALVLLAIGGIAVFFHLQHWERIFNGFGHITSGITQELIAIVVMVVVMVIMFAFIRRAGEDGKLPTWVGVLAAVVGIVLVLVCAHSYNMDSRPAWNSILQILSVFGSACVLGPATFAVLCKADEAGAFTGLANFAGSIAGLVLTVVYLISMNFASYTSFDSTYFDPTQPTKALVDTSALSVFSGDTMVFSIIVIIAGIAAVVAAYMGKSKGNWKIWGSVIIVCGVAAAICLRIVFYLMGVSVYPYM